MPGDAEVPFDADAHNDVAVVGGGPAGCSAAVFTARYGLDTAVFDSGPSSLRRCAFLSNYLGFPAGIDIETFLDLAQAQAEAAGATLEEHRVEAIERPDTDGPFRISLAKGPTHAADAVIAATRSTGEYLRPLGGDAMFDTHEHDGEVHEHFDRDYADADGRTPIEHLYVASPSGERDVQAIVAAGQGAHVARRLLKDRRSAAGYPDGLDEVYDWLRPDAEFAGDWGTRDGWREYFDSRLPEDAEPAEDEELREIRERYVDRAMATRRSEDEIAALTEEATDALVEELGPDRLLDAIDDERIRAHLADGDDPIDESIDDAIDAAEVGPDG